MKKYEVIGRGVKVAADNKVVLSAEQYRRRRHNLKALDEDEGIYLVLTPIEFKLGEIFSTDCDINLKLGTVIDTEVEIESDNKSDKKLSKKAAKKAESDKKLSKKAAKKAAKKAESENKAPDESKSEENLLDVLG